MKHMSLLLLTMVVILPLSACAMFRDRPSPAAGGGERPAGVTREGLERELRAQVEEYLAKSAGKSAADARIESYAPYYFKVYNIYPGGSSGYTLEMRETEARTAPYAADVRVARQRIATVMHRSRQAARDDDTFLRETGTEVLTYEYRNGRWVRSGSLFLVDRTEQQTASGWEPVEAAPPRMAPGAERGNWFSRTWSGLVGR